MTATAMSSGAPGAVAEQLLIMMNRKYSFVSRVKTLNDNRMFDLYEVMSRLHKLRHSFVQVYFMQLQRRHSHRGRLASHQFTRPT